jgi:hypothetical protein
MHKSKEVLSMKPETEGKIKYGAWGLVFGAVISMIIGFVWGGWKTVGMTKTITDKAVLASHAAICVGQFVQDSHYVEKLTEFGKLSVWPRADFIEKGGWDKMPGQEKADYGVARACADGLALLIKK